jgi:hypothetical protein
VTWDMISGFFVADIGENADIGGGNNPSPDGICQVVRIPDVLRIIAILSTPQFADAISARPGPGGASVKPMYRAGPEPDIGSLPGRDSDTGKRHHDMSRYRVKKKTRYQDTWPDIWS